ncbi:MULTISPECIES: transglycosylase SLT domain-containing protein [Pseudomonas syringae group]|uniref:transglycosylase SLT domain-containing protein n=1 Tax=Pseudomonas syringae group TaxID=136849 RepID=UPI001E4C1A4B|nr:MULTISPECIES: transglycosylase SLT domain-containing protein [Pseudomonas syringae group]
MIRSIVALGLALNAASAICSPYDSMIDRAARNHGVDPIVLRAIAAHESNKNPWTFNADGEPFRYQDKETAVRVLWSLTKAPWMVKAISLKGERFRRFFTSQASANSYAKNIRDSSRLILRVDDSKVVNKGEVRVRALRLINTDIGIAQVNYRWNGQGIATVQTWFDPHYNLEFAATRIAELKKKHKNEIEAVGYYHSATPVYRKKYLEYFIPKYNEEKRLATVSMAAAR